MSTLLNGNYPQRPLPSNPNYPSDPLKVADLTKLIFSYLDPVSLSLASRVCKNWYTTANDNTLWTAFIIRDHLWYDVNLKNSVLRQFGQNRTSIITKDKNHLFTQVINFLAQQHWNQVATYTCRLGPKPDNQILMIVKRNPQCPSGDNRARLEPLNTRFFTDVGPAQPDPLKLPSIQLKSSINEQFLGLGLNEYYVSIPSPVENHSGCFEAQVLMPSSVSALYLSHFKVLVDNQLAKLAKEEKSLKKKETIMRVAVIGYAVEEKGMYGNSTDSSPIQRLKDKSLSYLNLS